MMIRSFDPVERLRASAGYGAVVRSIWLMIAMVGLVALVNDIAAIATAT